MFRFFRKMSKPEPLFLTEDSASNFPIPEFNDPPEFEVAFWNEMSKFQIEFQLYRKLSYSNNPSDRIWFSEVLELTDQSRRCFIAKLVYAGNLYLRAANTDSEKDHAKYAESRNIAYKFSKNHLSSDARSIWHGMEDIYFGQGLISEMYKDEQDTTQAWRQANEERWDSPRPAALRKRILIEHKKNEKIREEARKHAKEMAKLDTEWNGLDLSVAESDSVAIVTPNYPESKLIRTPRDAEESAAEWMIYFGFSDARVTPVGPDAGIDVISSEAVVQVKMEGAPTSRPAVQQLYGVASSKGLQPFFFSLAGFTRDAISWGTEQKIALFTFDYQGKPEAVNAIAESYIATIGE
jgi:hypothetical protein